MWIRVPRPVLIIDPHGAFYRFAHLCLFELIHSFMGSWIIIIESINFNDTKPRIKVLNTTKLCSSPLFTQSKWTRLLFVMNLCFTHREDSAPFFRINPFLRVSGLWLLSRWLCLYVKVGVIDNHRPIILTHSGRNWHLPSSKVLQPQRVNNWDLYQRRNALDKWDENIKRDVNMLWKHVKCPPPLKRWSLVGLSWTNHKF